MIHLFVTISFIPALVLSDLPISDAFADRVRVDKTLPYNLVDTNPTCFWKGVCPFRPGGELGTFPNSEERFQHILHNMHRMFPNNSLATPLGSRFYGTNGEDSWWRNGEYCGSTDKARLPMYWYSNANQLARFKQWDEKTCNQSWYTATVIDASGEEATNDNHVTCKYGTTQPHISFTASGGSSAQFSVPSGVNRCSLFGNDCGQNANESCCGYGARASAYCDDSIKDIDRCWFEAEGICGGNSCLDSSAHCDPIFASKYNYVGKGFVEGMNGATSVYNRWAKLIWYLLPIAAHFDERVKIHSDDLRSDGKHFGLMLEYFDANATQTPRRCYALYAGAIHELSVFISDNHPHEVEANNYRSGQDGTDLSGTWNPDPDWYSIDDYNVLFLQYFDPPEATCEPYAFICKTSLGNMFRLPEDGDYYFGTEWLDYVYTNYSRNQNYDCKENHYYSHETEGWTVNGGPDLTQSDIWYYAEGNECIGCDKIEILDCLSQCIYDASDSVPTQTCQDACVVTAAPTTAAPIAYPDCTAFIYYKKVFTGVASWDEATEGDTKIEEGRQAFIAENSECGDATETTPELEFFYRFAYNSATLKLPLHLWVCCGRGKRFGRDYTVPSSVGNYAKYVANAAWDAHNPPTTPSPTTGEPPNCNPVINYRKIWGYISSWDEATMEDEYVEKGRQKFIKFNPECGDATESEPELEFFYRFKYVTTKEKLKMFIHGCCGKGKRFGNAYGVPSDITSYKKYKANPAWTYHNGETLKEGNEWTDPAQFGVKQYVVFSLSGLMLIGCVVGAIYGAKYYAKEKEKKEEKKKEMETERDLAESIQMHATSMSSVPGPTNAPLQGTQTGGDGSTDGSNRYTSQFIKEPRESASILNPPMRLLGHHDAVPSTSYERSVPDTANTTAKKASFVGIPPPRMSSVAKADDTCIAEEEEQLDV